MREPGSGGAALLVDEAEAVKGRGALPDPFVAHEGELGDGEPVACGDVVACGGGVGDHDFAGGADYFGISILLVWRMFLTGMRERVWVWLTERTWPKGGGLFDEAVEIRHLLIQGTEGDVFAF